MAVNHEQIRVLQQAAGNCLHRLELAVDLISSEASQEQSPSEPATPRIG